jgi:hypothetical protein
VVSICTTRFNVNIPSMCLSARVYLLVSMALIITVISLYRISRLLFVMGRHCDLWEEGMEFFNIMHTSLWLQGVKIDLLGASGRQDHTMKIISSYWHFSLIVLLNYVFFWAITSKNTCCCGVFSQWNVNATCLKVTLYVLNISCFSCKPVLNILQSKQFGLKDMRKCVFA